MAVLTGDDVRCKPTAWITGNLCCRRHGDNPKERPVTHGVISANIYASVWVIKPLRVMKVILVGSLVCTIDRSGYFLIDLSKSISARTRNMVNYA